MLLHILHGFCEKESEAVWCMNQSLRTNQLSCRLFEEEEEDDETMVLLISIPDSDRLF